MSGVKKSNRKFRKKLNEGIPKEDMIKLVCVELYRRRDVSSEVMYVRKSLS